MENFELNQQELTYVAGLGAVGLVDDIDALESSDSYRMQERPAKSHWWDDVVVKITY